MAAASVMTVAPACAAHGQGAGATGTVTAQVRVDQRGWAPGEVKHASLMATRRLHAATWAVVDGHGRAVVHGRVPRASSGRWSSAYPAVYTLDLSRLHRPGRYRVVTGGDVHATSPSFRITGTTTLATPLVSDGVRFVQNQRDGHDQIPGPLHRRPAHLNDARAHVYAWPHMIRGEDTITDRDLTRIGGAVDVEGGWFDAGDYLKFTHSSAYADVILFSSARSMGARAPRALVTEARYGLRWLERMWDPRTDTLHLQVGIGSGNRQGTFTGDHDHWRLPQADDGLSDPVDRYVAHRPVFDAAVSGQPISPNLAGRVSAAFALGAQQEPDRTRARALLARARALYARADTASPPRPLVTALPHAFYPESVWADDMELGAAEIARASVALDEPAATYLRSAAHWARAYLARRSTDTLNLYDVGALAHASLADAMDAVPGHETLEVTRAQLVADLARQLDRGVRQAATDPFGAPVDLTEFDANSHSFGLVATAALYQRLTGSTRYVPFASDVRAWLLGRNPWGVSAMVGIGSTYPQCMQHQVANAATAPDLGAVVNGPNGQDNFEGGLGGFQDGMRHCSRPAYHQYDGRGSRYVDDVRAWQTDEPALDMTGAAILAGATTLAAGAR